MTILPPNLYKHRYCTTCNKIFKRSKLKYLVYKKNSNIPHRTVYSIDKAVNILEGMGSGEVWGKRKFVRRCKCSVIGSVGVSDILMEL